MDLEQALLNFVSVCSFILFIAILCCLGKAAKLCLRGCRDSSKYIALGRTFANTFNAPLLAPRTGDRSILPDFEAGNFASLFALSNSEYRRGVDQSSSIVRAPDEISAQHLAEENLDREPIPITETGVIQEDIVGYGIPKQDMAPFPSRSRPEIALSGAIDQGNKVTDAVDLGDETLELDTASQSSQNSNDQFNSSVENAHESFKVDRKTLQELPESDTRILMIFRRAKAYRLSNWREDWSAFQGLVDNGCLADRGGPPVWISLMNGRVDHRILSDAVGIDDEAYLVIYTFEFLRRKSKSKDDVIAFLIGAAKSCNFLQGKDMDGMLYFVWSPTQARI